MRLKELFVDEFSRYVSGRRMRETNLGNYVVREELETVHKLADKTIDREIIR